MTLHLRGNIWYYDFVIGGRRHAGSTGLTSQTEALRAEEKLKVQFRENYSPKQIWEQTKHSLCQSARTPLAPEVLWQAFAAKSLTRAGEARKNIYRKHILDFVTWMARRHPECASAGDVTTDMAREYVAAMRQEAGAPSTKNDRLTTLKLLFRVLGQEAGVIENPFVDIAPMKGERISREIYSRDELRLIGDNATGWVLDLCLTAISTGLREGDICNMTRDCLSHDLRWIHLDRVRKTGKALDIPVLPRLREHFAEALAGNETQWVYPTLRNMYEHNRMGIGKGIKKFLQEIGVDGARRTVENYARQISSKDVHSFRHTFVYLAACNHIPFPIVQSIVGHASPAMTKIYMDHASGEDKERYLAQLPEYMLSDAPATASPVQRVIDMIEADAPKAEVLAALRAIL